MHVDCIQRLRHPPSGASSRVQQRASALAVLGAAEAIDDEFALDANSAAMIVTRGFSAYLENLKIGDVG